MRYRKIWIALVPSGFYWLCKWIDCVLVEYQSKQVNCFLSDGNKNLLLECRGYKRPPPVKNSFAPRNYFVQCNGFFFFLFRIFASKIKHKVFSWSQKSNKFCTCDLSLSNCHTCDNRTPKRRDIQSKVCTSVITYVCELFHYPVCIAKILLCYASLRLFQTGSKGGKYSGLNNAEICKVYRQSVSVQKKKKRGSENNNREQL